MQSLEFRDVLMASFDFDPHSIIIEDNRVTQGKWKAYGDSVFNHCAASSRNCSSSLKLPTSVPGGTGTEEFKTRLGYTVTTKEVWAPV